MFVIYSSQFHRLKISFDATAINKNTALLNKVVYILDMLSAQGRAGTQYRSGHNITKGTAGERGKMDAGGRREMEMDKHGMQVTMRGRENTKGWTRWIH